MTDKAASPVFMCEANGCDRLADWAYIGEGGDLFICDFHGGVALIDGWTRIDHSGRDNTDSSVST